MLFISLAWYLVEMCETFWLGMFVAITLANEISLTSRIIYSLHPQCAVLLQNNFACNDHCGMFNFNTVIQQRAHSMWYI